MRQAVELGADIIKADPPDDVDVYGKVIEIAGRIPVLRSRRRRKRRTVEILERGPGKTDSARRGRNRLWPQHHPTRQPCRDDAGADGDVHRRALEGPPEAAKWIKG